MKIKTLKLEGNRFITENDQDDTIGEIKEDGTVVKEYFGQGLIYKNFKNFEQKSGPCYIAEYQGEKGTGFHDNIVSDELKTKNFNDMVEGEDYETYDTIIKQVKDEYARRNQKVSEQTIEDTAKEIFYEVDWQYISSLLDEWLDAEVDEVEYAVNIKNKETNEFIYQYDVYATYDEALQSAKTIDLKDKEIYEIVEIKYDENGDELGINTITDSTLEECNSLKEKYSLVGIYTDEHGMEKKDYIKDFDDKGDIDKYMADNEDELKAKNYDKIITESKKDDKFQANLSLHSKFGIDKGSKLIQELDTALEQNDKQKIKKLANKFKKELSPNDYNSFIKTYYPEYINILEEKEIKVTENSHKVNMIYTPIVENKVITNRARRLKLEAKELNNDIVWANGFTLDKLRDAIKNDFDGIKETIDICYIEDRQGGTSVYLAKYNGELYLTLSKHNKADFDDDFENVDAILVDKNKVANSTEADFIKYIHYLYKYLKGLQKPIKLGSSKSTVKKESLSQDEEDAIYSAEDFGELLDTLDGMKQDAKVQRARNLTSHAYTHIPDEEEDERLDEIKDEVISILTESYKDGWKPEVDLYTKLMKEMQDNLGISEYEIQKEADAIKFRYNGKVYFAEPVSMYQVDVFDDNRNQIGYGVGVDDIKEEVFTKYTDNDYLYELVGGEYAGTYTREEAEKLPIREPELTDDLDDIRARGGFVHRKELDNQFQFKGYLGPMWNGTQDGKAVIRYETQQVYNQLSK